MNRFKINANHLLCQVGIGSIALTIDLFVRGVDSIWARVVIAALT